ncbi:MAG: MFS transporter [Mycobacteriales bacterium]
MTAADLTAAPTAGATFRQVFAVGEFRVLFGSWVLFILGETMQVFSLATLVYQQTGSALWQSLAYVIGFLPQALGGGLLLALADRLPARGLVSGCDLVRAGVLVFLATCGLPVGVLLAVVFAKSMLVPVWGAARSGLVADVLTGDAYVLGRSVMSVAGSGMQIAGMAFGGVLVGLTNPRYALLVTATTCLCSAVLVRFGLRARTARGRSAPGSGLIGSTWAGNRRLLGDPAVRGLLACQWLFPALSTGAISLGLPYVHQLGHHNGAASLLIGALPAGMLAGDLVVGRFVSPAGRERLSLPLAVLLAAPLLGLLARPALAVSAVLVGLTGAGSAYALGLQRRFLTALPDGIRNQGFGLAATGLMTAQGLGAIGCGALAQATGSASAVMATAGALGLLGAALLGRHLRPPRERLRPLPG